MRQDKRNGWSGMVLFRHYETVSVLCKEFECSAVTHLSKLNRIPSTISTRVGRLQLKPSKCPLRIRSPIGDGARLTGFLGGLLPRFNGVLPLVGLFGKAVFGGTAGAWSLPPKPGCGLENDVLRERRRKRPLARSWRSPASGFIGCEGVVAVQEVVARRWTLWSGAGLGSWVSSSSKTVPVLPIESTVPLLKGNVLAGPVC